MTPSTKTATTSAQPEVAARPGSLRVLMVAPTSFFGHYGGHIRIVEEVRALQALGHEVTVVTYYKGEEVDGVRIVRTRRLPWRADYEVGSSRHKLAFDLYLLWRVLRFGFQWRPHLVHGHMHEGALIGGLLARLMRVPLIFDFQGSLTGEMLDHGFIRRDSAAFRGWSALEQFICRLPDTILTSSVQAGELLRDQFGVAGERIAALSDCADLDHFAPGVASPEAHAELRRRFGIPADRPIVAYLGLLAEYQGTEHLLQAAARLKADGDDVHFLIMGYPKVDYYSALAGQMGIADRVTFTGRVDYYRDAPLYLSLGEVAVSPKFSATEGSGKVLNYMAMGQPVVAYDTPVHREYLGDAGVYVPAGDVAAFAVAIRELLADSARRQELGQALRQRAASYYSWDVAGRRIDAIYRRLVQQQSYLRNRETV